MLDINFSEGLPALPPDNDDLLSDDETPDEDDREPEEENAVPPLPSQPESRPAPLAPQPPRHTVAGSERWPGGGINWWRMYRFPPMVVPRRSGASGSAYSPTSPSSSSSPPIPSATATKTSDTPFAECQHNDATPLQGAQSQDENMVVHVIVIGLESVHGHGHHTHGDRHAEGRNEHHHSR